MTGKTVLILASNSPRRRQLLALGNWMFNVIVANVDETPFPGEKPAAYVRRLAEAKARAVVGLARPNNIIVAADTAVVDGESILGKPADIAEAASMLRQLRGRVHQVQTGIAVLRVSDGLLLADLCVTDVPMRNYSDEEIETYALSGDPLDKAGAYAIQHAGFNPVEQFHGCFASVMGLPLCHLVRVMAKLGVYPSVNLPVACQTALQYPCPVSRAILRGEQVG
ncbi:MAG: Maf family protein [Chloroflexota bacterium]